MSRALVTGGAGFLGSHLVERLLSVGYEVIVTDNLSTGNLSNLSKCSEDKKFRFYKNDLKNYDDVKEILNDIEIIFHLAADPEVRKGFTEPEISYKENIRNTFHLLEAIRKSNVSTIYFTSTSTIYGEPTIMPTPENYGPLLPISHYGASKLACEALISSYCNNYGIRGQLFRLANIIGSRSNHGIIWDFINKLQVDKNNLEILGDGTQSKSYLHVNDCIDCFLFCLSKFNSKIEAINVGNNDKIDVVSIAKIVCDKMKLDNVKFVTTGGVDSGRGWIGDVKQMHLDISKLKEVGWAPKLSSYEAVQLSSQEILKEKLASE